MQEEYNGGMHIMMEKLSLDKFEEAYERVQEVVLPTNLVQSDFFSQMTGNKVYFKRKICSIQVLTRYVEHIIKSVH